jgi:hypothetical protein
MDEGISDKSFPRLTMLQITNKINPIENAFLSIVSIKSYGANIMVLRH